MCGIFGLVIENNKFFEDEFIKTVVDQLFIYSETRGKEAAGIAFKIGNSIDILKKACRASQFIKDEKFKKLLKNKLSDDKKIFSFIGHSRLVTNGFQFNNNNNQPVVTSDLVGIHNGIITNCNDILKRYKDIKVSSELDSEILLQLIKRNLDLTKNDLKDAISKTFEKIRGSASLASYSNKNGNLFLATNTGSLFYIVSKTKNFFAFASERFILKKIIESRNFLKKFGHVEIHQIKSFNILNIDLNKLKIKESTFKSKKIFRINNTLVNNKNNNFKILDHSQNFQSLKRCTKCILPETYPYIDFDNQGVCRHCRNFKPTYIEGEKVLLEKIKKYRNSDGRPDCIVALSGGRDSCYGLHYIKKNLGMNPVAFTYDWGFVTDLARRNCARVCGKLGVEHIIRTPDIAQKRMFVRKNIQAWLKRPELGMIPLFMAGDKAFFYHARKLRKEVGAELVFFCGGNSLETTHFKFEFSGIKDGEKKQNLIDTKFTDKLKLISYYIKNFILNPYYFNDSIFDTAKAYMHTFLNKNDFLWLYHFIEWEEKNIVNTIIKEYEWETSNDTKTTWRIGDGTASFYNYIYQTIAGFTEDDDMLSNMIRQNYITRDEALKRSKEFSNPRSKSIEDYLQKVGLNLEETLSKINEIPKIY